MYKEDQENQIYLEEKSEYLTTFSNKTTSSFHRGGGDLSLWEEDKEWASTLLNKAMPEELAVSVFSLYVAKREKYISSKGQSKRANIWA